MSRPLMQYGVKNLEEMFAKGNADLKVLKRLENELQHRQVPRAVALLTEVQAAMYGETSAVGPIVSPPSAAQTATPASKQPGLFEHPSAPSAVVAQTPILVRLQPLSVAHVPPKPLAPATMTISVDDAYKLLKVTPGSTWESIEQTRRLLVQQAHPSDVAALSAEKRAEARAKAARVNAAYLRLSTLRCRSQYGSQGV